MTKRIIFEIILICVLGTVGWYLFGIMKQAEIGNPEQRAIESYNRLVFANGSGIDVMGNKIDSIAQNKTDNVDKEFPVKLGGSTKQKDAKADNSASKTDDSDQKESIVAFLLRHDTLDSDLRFWNEVKSHLSELNLNTVKLTAYCESARCAETIRANPDIAHFTVLEYGNATDMQAVIGADAAGEFCLRGKGAEKINWRNRTKTPRDIVNSIGLRP